MGMRELLLKEIKQNRDGNISVGAMLLARVDILSEPKKSGQTSLLRLNSFLSHLFSLI